MLRSMLPDLRITVEAVIAEGDFVVSRYTATATDTVGYMGMPGRSRYAATTRSAAGAGQRRSTLTVVQGGVNRSRTASVKSVS